MGLSLQRAQNLDGKAVQVVLVDAEGDKPVSASARAWANNKERRQVVVALGGEAKATRRADTAASRPCYAVIFGDFPGFSRMAEKYVTVFWDTVTRAIGDIVAERGRAVVLKSTWGDAIHLVVPDAHEAAGICLSIQETLSKIDGRMLGRAEPPAMRLLLHHGPAIEGWDAIQAHHTYYGRAISRAAHVEPITPPGRVYVTEAFAAILLVESKGEFVCNYVGQVPLARGEGAFRLYDLSAST